MDTSCVILAGGKSVRLGHDKILETVGKQSLLERVIACIDSLAAEIIIVTGEARSFPQFSDHPKVKVVTDIFPGRGSLGGIYTGLATSGSFYNLVVAADMPFLCRPLLDYMIKVSDGFDFVLPRVNNLYEPLHAVYSRNCIAPAERMIAEGRKVIIDLFNDVKVRFVEAEEVDRFDPEHLSFFNINTQGDLDKAREIAGRIDS